MNHDKVDIREKKQLKPTQLSDGHSTSTPSGSRKFHTLIKTKSPSVISEVSFKFKDKIFNFKTLDELIYFHKSLGDFIVS